MNIVTICYRSGKAQYMPWFMEKRIGMERLDHIAIVANLQPWGACGGF
jgi:hypothetical protein